MNNTQESDTPKDEYSLYSKPDCNACIVAEQLLKSNNKEYTKLLLDVHFNITELFAVCPTPPRSFPVLLKGGKYLGGLKELKAELGVL